MHQKTIDVEQRYRQGSQFAIQVVAFKTEQAHRRLSKYLDALEILAPQKIVDDVDYREYRESKLQEVE
jgi:predicted nucleic acid-binding protein